MRTNLLRTAAGGYLILDYGHNPEAFAAVCQTASRWRGRRVTGIIGVPGDRSDELIERAGRVAARGFERVVIKEDEDTRGRRRGEVAEILRRAVHEETHWRECSVTLSEREALREELRRQQPGDVLVLFYDKSEPLRPVLEEFGAEPVAAIEGVEAVEEPLTVAAYAAAAHAGDDAASAAAGRADVRRRKVSQEWQGYIWR